jgi:hypothetical protein
MRVNLAPWDRILRGLLGFLLSSYFFAGGPPWAALGLYLIATSSFGWCLIYALFRIRTASLTRYDLMLR